MTHEKYKDTIEGYHLLADEYEKKFMRLDLYNDSYDAFCNLIVTDKASILELGCGPGNIPAYILPKHPQWKWLSTDGATAMVELAAKNNLSAECKVLNLLDVDFLEQKFEGVVAGFCIPYIDLDDLHRFLPKIHERLNENGIFYLSFIQGDYNQSTLQTSSDGKVSMQVYYYQPEDILSNPVLNLFTVVQEFSIPYPGTEQVHFVLLLRKK